MGPDMVDWVYGWIEFVFLEDLVKNDGYDASSLENEL